MSGGSKVHYKLKKPKNATVSLDSLLGLLSSAYGTEELDSKSIFQENTVNWKRISIESFECATKKQNKPIEREKIKNVTNKEIDKTNAATSTTGLKPKNSSQTKVDLTLVSIKSLEKIVMPNEKSKNNPTEECKPSSLGESCVTNPSEDKLTECEMGDNKSSGDYFEVQEDLRVTVCGFYINDISGKVVFDVQFLKKRDQSEIIPSFDLCEPEISMDVTDLLKQTKTLIKVGQRYLVSKIQYFADVDKEFGLENLDIKIKCSLSVFQWIIQWVKADIVMCKPCLNVSNLKSIFSMAYHLGIDLLVDECIDFFYNNFRDVLRVDYEIETVFQEDVLLKIVKLFTNSEIEKISDAFLSFKTKMFIALIKLLVNPNPCFTIGHFSSLATMFQCGNCYKLLLDDNKHFVPCRSDFNQLDFKGNLIPLHKCSSSWDLSKYIELMFEELKSWRLVYWRLWGLCHFLTCSSCYKLFPLCQHDWCPYHPTEVEYFPLEPNLSHPIGMYSCCGEKYFRFNVLAPYSGCQFKSHAPLLDSDINKALYQVFDDYKSLISCTPPENLVIKKFVKLMKKDCIDKSKTDTPENFWWNGILLAPKERKDYSLIPQDVLNRLRNKYLPNSDSQMSNKFLTYGPFVPFTIMTPCPLKVPITPSLVETIPLSPIKNKKKPKVVIKKIKSSHMISPMKNVKRKKSSFVYQPTESVWVPTDSNKMNQDNQRDFEESAMRSLVKMLSPSTSASPARPAAGSYIRLESEWWQEHGSEARSSGLGKNSGTVVNRTFPLSWFRRLTL